MEKNMKMKIYIYIYECVTHSLCCTVEISTSLLISYFFNSVFRQCWWPCCPALWSPILLCVIPSHFPAASKKWKCSSLSRVWLCVTPRTVAPGSSVHRILQARILEWDSHSLLQGIFPIQKSNPGLLHCRHILYHLRPQGSRNTQLLSSWNILTVLHFSWEEGPQEFKSSSGCLSSTIFFFFFLDKKCANLT